MEQSGTESQKSTVHEHQDKDRKSEWSEYQVQSAIDSMIERGGITVVIIAHRLSTIRKADRIVVIEAGKVVEMGNHSSLMQKEGGHYASLAKRQLAPNPAVPSADANKDEEVKSVA